MRSYLYRKGKKSVRLSELKLEKPSIEASVILPTYNEEGNIERLIKAITGALKGTSYEIVVVDDDSKDGTPKIIDRYAKKGNVAALHRYGKRGIFSAIRDGIKVAKGKVVVIMDADFSHPPQLLPKLIAHSKNYDLVSGSRFCKGAGIKAPFIRAFATWLFNSVIRFILGLRITDWTGGFHAIRKDAFLNLRFRYPASWGEFDLELLYRSKRKKLSIKEVPFVYSFREEGSSKSAQGFGFFFGYAFKYGIRSLRLKFFDWL
ncbi:polyprenol monophosphomannose synthase [Candidatus Woesearchaeota archaeon]|nr:polyprenol monophosphomannose synthase [Candidatus Woesearchaeota archaeon]